jgi:formate dehydrogenase major subunit
VPGLGATYGRGAATSTQEDLQNSDCILMMGSNMAEAHPVGFRFPMKAREKGAKLIHVDPHYSRTSACANAYVPIRAGTDIAFLGGLINQVLTQERWFKDYVLAYTNATTIITDEYVDAEDNGGIFSGFDEGTSTYNQTDTNWQYASEPGQPRTNTPPEAKGEMRSQTSGQLASNKPETDPTLRHPNCVLNILRRHYARYTPEMVADICGCAKEQFMGVAEDLMANSGRERTSAIVYAVGWTHHVTGVQIIRTGAMLQLLLGNMGRPGGGIMAMRGHASIQGSTDIPTLYNLLPGYIAQPTAGRDHNTLAGYLEQERVDYGLMANLPKYMVSFLKAWYGDAATKENDYGFAWLPRVTEDHSHLPTMIRMAEGKVRGFFVIGQNPAVGTPNARLCREGLRQLDWLVVRDIFQIETATFWKDGPDAPDPAAIKTEVFFLPAALVAEKPGTLTNTQRLVQWHDKAVDPPGDCRSDLHFMWHLGKRLRELYKGSAAPRDQGLLNMTWDYASDESPETLPDGTVSRVTDEPSATKVLKEINGYGVADGRQLAGFQELRDDGGTACGCWIYSGIFPDDRHNRAADRVSDPAARVNLTWAWAWPANRRIMYNRASADPAGKPWSERKAYMYWDEARGAWAGPDVPDFPPDKRPDYRAAPDAKGMDAIDGDSPFILKPDGKGWLFAPSGAKDGPLPTHYEPVESPVGNALYKQRTNPMAQFDQVPLNPMAPQDPEFPLVVTTYRLTEHYLSGPMSRFDSWLNELQPAMFVEMSPELATERGVAHGDWVTISSARSTIEARAMVSPRIRPLRVGGRVVHQVGLPIHYGYSGEVAGSNANELAAMESDPNVSMHESKAFTCQIRKGRLARPSDVPSVPVAPRAQAAPMAATPDQAQPEGRRA